MAHKFIADAMLGRLARWLRILGHDTHYLRRFGGEGMDRHFLEGRILLTRKRIRITEYPDAFLVRSDHVGDQLIEMKQEGFIRADKSLRFTRCLTCNVPLEKPPVDKARENVPEYIFYEKMNSIRFCPDCCRYYWPGSHRERMIRQLDKWGL